MRIRRFFSWMTAFMGVALISLAISCKKDDKAYYIEQIAVMADQLNKTCPKDQSNGAVLESVTFANNSLIYRSAISEQSLGKLNMTTVRDSLVSNIPANLKEFLIKGNCSLEYRYITPGDSLSVFIIPSDLTAQETK